MILDAIAWYLMKLKEVPKKYPRSNQKYPKVSKSLLKYPEVPKSTKSPKQYQKQPEKTKSTYRVSKKN